jgi:hypothetical protein
VSAARWPSRVLTIDSDQAASDLQLTAMPSPGARCNLRDRASRSAVLAGSNMRSLSRILRAVVGASSIGLSLVRKHGVRAFVHDLVEGAKPTQHVQDFR